VKAIARRLRTGSRRCYWSCARRVGDWPWITTRACSSSESGFLPTGPCGLVDLCKVPDGLNAEETERFLRENAAETAVSARRGPAKKATDIEG
jgi:hypothetical protein